jgi:hypothetical protein
MNIQQLAKAEYSSYLLPIPRYATEEEKEKIRNLIQVDDFSGSDYWVKVREEFFQASIEQLLMHYQAEGRLDPSDDAGRHNRIEQLERARSLVVEQMQIVEVSLNMRFVNLTLLKLPSSYLVPIEFLELNEKSELQSLLKKLQG